MKKYINNQNVMTLLISLLLFSCSDDFIEEKRDFSSVNTEIYQYEELATAYLDHLYYLMLPDGNVNMAAWSRAAVEHSNADLFAKSSDQLAGEVALNRDWPDISPINDHCLRSLGQRISASTQNNTYTRIRYCNSYINNVDDYSGLDEDFKSQIKGQFYFWRAWQYFELVRLYGGVPLVLEAQPSNVDDPGNQTPRSSSSEVINQIVADLETSQTLLENGRPYTEDDSGRITAAAAAALKGRVLLTWASPLFNRNDDQGRWQSAYEANLAAYNICIESGKGLAPDWKTMWFEDVGMESVFAFRFNDFTSSAEGIAKNNYTEYQSRSEAQDGNGGISPTKNVVDAFPMEDGTPYDPNSDLNDFYKNRDPRFYYTFAYNGSIWPYSGNPEYRNWTYFWHVNTDPNGPVRPTDVTQNASGIYLRKFTNDNSSNTNQFRNSGAEYMEIRFAEVVLNLAESAIGVGNLAEGKDHIKSIRARAGVINGDGSYGLASANSRDQLFAAVINERKVEFAYENKRFHDLRRWLLYNNDFGTCARLNQTPIEGTRRQGYYTIVTNSDGTLYTTPAPDPLLGPGAPLINRDTTTYPDGITTYDDYVDYLYDNYFQVIVRDDLDEEGFTFEWYNEYYFFGIPQNLLLTAPYLNQTTGWGGSFDPLN